MKPQDTLVYEVGMCGVSLRIGSTKWFTMNRYSAMGPYAAFHPANDFGAFYRDRRVLVTGHTGFKGSWLCTWLEHLGARVTGFSDTIPTRPALFDQLGIAGKMTDLRGDICDVEAIDAAIALANPEVIFHLAAQSLVRRSYREPVATWHANLMGTIHVMEALRRRTDPVVLVVITSDKCYENKNWVYGYRETDALGGHDPYSASKAAVEIAVESWRRSFFSNRNTAITTTRAGNVIGGGDWAADRIIPDCIRALQSGAPITVRNPNATRPWQHVLEPLSGYLCLGAALHKCAGDDPLCTAWNFGPDALGTRSVAELVNHVLDVWPRHYETASTVAQDVPHEAAVLQLSTEKARSLLGWSPRWNFEETVTRTVSWYQDIARIGNDAGLITQRTLQDIDAYAR